MVVGSEKNSVVIVTICLVKKLCCSCEDGGEKTITLDVDAHQDSGTDHAHIWESMKMVGQMS
jgi:hypothetical protein